MVRGGCRGLVNVKASCDTILPTDSVQAAASAANAISTLLVGMVLLHQRLQLLLVIPRLLVRVTLLQRGAADLDASRRVVGSGARHAQYLLHLLLASDVVLLLLLLLLLVENPLLRLDVALLLVLLVVRVLLIQVVRVRLRLRGDVLDH